MPAKHIFSVPGSRRARSPLIRLSGIRLNLSSNVRRSSVTYAASRSRFSMASCSAAAIPTMAGTFSVPARLPRSWAPPSITLVSATPRRAYNTPAPLGPWNLCADRDKRSISLCVICSRVCPTACTASVWNSTPWARQILPISATGCKVPISLLAAIMVTKQVFSSRAASSSAGRTIPFSCTGSSSTVKPSFSSAAKVCSTAWCSKAEEMILVLPLRRPIAAAERMAWLSASDPPEGK